MKLLSPEMCASSNLDDVDMMISQLELRELESPDCVARSEEYAHLMVLYFVKNDLCSAKFLWKRIPNDMKEPNSELSQLWDLGVKLWKNDSAGIHAANSKTWSPNIHPFIVNLTDRHLEHSLHNVENAYSNLTLPALASRLGVSNESAIQIIQSRGWRYDEANNLVFPVKPEHPKGSSVNFNNKLKNMIDSVSFLENTD